MSWPPERAWLVASTVGAVRLAGRPRGRRPCHLILFVAAGAILAWRWPKLLWLHLPAVTYAGAILTIHFDCPLTALEKYLRRQAGQQQYSGGFVRHYVTNVVYPGSLTPVLQAGAALCIGIGYAGLLVRWRRTHEGAPTAS